ncbi:MAG: molybdopterin molybdotransferase MoeA, partial [Thiovulaceae bacterium]|nr:molybdopterin molybdotransferase MoeA [Sulfurimonadaceae bacterium]
NGVCIKTFTGSVMPDGADTLIPIENVTVEGDAIIINEEVPLGFSVRPVGESYAAGDVLIKRGAKIGFAEIGVMAGLNTAVVPVALKPRLATLSTGSELLEIGQTQENVAQIRSSNHHTIEAIATMAGAEVVQMGVVKDDRASITAAFENALASADIVVSTGGVSVGDYDFVKDVIPALGAEVIFKGVKIKPGQHILVAQKGEKFILGLPGFAYSSTVTFLLYAVPLIKKYLGAQKVFEMVEATLAEPFNKRSRKSEFTACNLSFKDGKYVVDFEGKKVGTSAILTNMLGDAALIVSSEEDGPKEAGATVKVIKLDQF